MDVTTSVKIQHEYAIGSLYDVKRGNLVSDSIKKTFDLEEAVSLYESNKGNGSSLIYVPNLIGVYRRIQIGFHPENPTGETVSRDCASEPYEGFDVHPSLVQIGFDPESFNVGALCDYIGEESRRMVITPYLNLDSGSDALRKFSDLTARRFNGMTEGKEFSKEERREYQTLIRELLKTDGLDKQCYNSLMNSSDIMLL